MRTALTAGLAACALLTLSACATTATAQSATAQSATPAAPLTQVEISAIQQACETVSFQYGRYLDGKDWQNLPSVFAPDGVWEVLGNRMEGRDAIRAYWQRRTADWAPDHGRLHQISNQVIEVIDRDHARGTSTVVVWFFNVAPSTNASFAPSLIARNVDEYVRTDEGWKLSLRRIEDVASLAPQH